MFVFLLCMNQTSLSASISSILTFEALLLPSLIQCPCMYKRYMAYPWDAFVARTQSKVWPEIKLHDESSKYQVVISYALIVTSMTEKYSLLSNL